MNFKNAYAESDLIPRETLRAILGEADQARAAARDLGSISDLKDSLRKLADRLELIVRNSI